MPQQFDRSAEDLGNAIHFEHVNIQVPDQRLATLFYVTGLGLTRDPYLMVSDTNMWINAGRSQFHLPDGKPQVLRGHTGLVIEGREALLARLASVAKKLEGTAFAFTEHNDHVEAICPWGNRLRCFEPDAVRFGRIALGIPYIEFEVPIGSAKAICAFYPEIMGMPARASRPTATNPEINRRFIENSVGFDMQSSLHYRITTNGQARMWPASPFTNLFFVFGAVLCGRRRQHASIPS